MIKMETPLGAVEISNDYFANLVGHAASECFGVAGMIESTTDKGLRYILRKEEAADKGVKVRYGENGLTIDLHIAVTYGVNISAIVKSIVNKVSYTVQEATGFQVAKVNVFVDDMKQ
ncbi:MAG: Asp23/Gls24 family envelope stress response protein [Oscillospiraceae bacterium]|nr:Asp23/Gls24 family envelope stress response protein [Oscillospiraceae bacterium]